MFLGEIIAVYVNEQCITDGKVDTKKIDPMIITSSGNYWNIGHAVGTIFKDGSAYKVTGHTIK
jgi:flavin reductase (DIM6/NTAB) family NADH-FMN oxidoreductase RutF